ncbi:MAG: DUF4054 domain-containing protein [Clostridia bacterium]|nr:DUF4054 domain-containing protein [Clostridia bacterium]
MTLSDFLAFYPQFSGVFPDVVLDSYIQSASCRFTDFGEDAEEAMRLYIAHKLTLYARSMPSTLGASGGVSSFSALASSGDGGRITSKKVDDVAITYSAGASSAAGASELADLKETTFGQQLLTLLRLYAYPRYVP